jgi:hypothetical protein
MGKVSMEDKMRMQTLHELGLGAKAIIAKYPSKQWKLSTVKKIPWKKYRETQNDRPFEARAAVDMGGFAAGAHQPGHQQLYKATAGMRDCSRWTHWTFDVTYYVWWFAKSVSQQTVSFDLMTLFCCLLQERVLNRKNQGVVTL